MSANDSIVTVRRFGRDYRLWRQAQRKGLQLDRDKEGFYYLTPVSFLRLRQEEDERRKQAQDAAFKAGADRFEYKVSIDAGLAFGPATLDQVEGFLRTCAPFR